METAATAEQGRQPPNWPIRSTAAPFFVDVGTSFSLGAGTAAAGNAISAISLPAGLSGLTAGTSVTFRMTMFGGTNTGGTGYINDPVNSTATDFSISGTITNGVTPGTPSIGSFAPRP